MSSLIERCDSVLEQLVLICGVPAFAQLRLVCLHAACSQSASIQGSTDLSAGA